MAHGLNVGAWFLVSKQASFVIFKLNLLPKLKKSKRPQNGTGHYKIIKRVTQGSLLARHLGDPSNGVHDPPLENFNWNAV